MGLKKIPPNTACTITETDLIGIGWTNGAPVMDINDHEKFMFRLVREVPSPPVTDIQSDNDLDYLEAKVAAIDRPIIKHENTNLQSPVLHTKHPIKRKLENDPVGIKVEHVAIKTEQPEVRSRIVFLNDDVINILSDSDDDDQQNLENVVKKPKLDSISEELPEIIMKKEIKPEQDDLEYNTFHVKQEYRYYDDPIYIDSESDADDESVQWMMRLSQSSPGKPFTKVRESKVDSHNEETSYSQIDDEVDFLHDFSSIPSERQDDPGSKLDSCYKATGVVSPTNIGDDEEFVDDLISIDHPVNDELGQLTDTAQMEQDVVDGMSNTYLYTEVTSSTSMDNEQDKGKKTQLIEPLIQIPRKKTIQPVIINSSKSCIFTLKKVLY